MAKKEKKEPKEERVFWHDFKTGVVKVKCWVRINQRPVMSAKEIEPGKRYIRKTRHSGWHVWPDAYRDKDLTQERFDGWKVFELIEVLT